MVQSKVEDHPDTRTDSDTIKDAIYPSKLDGSRNGAPEFGKVDILGR